MKPVFEDVLQVSCVVEDVCETVKVYYDKYGIGPWQVWEFDETNSDDLYQRGEKKSYAMRAATARIGSVDWELIQPLDENSIFSEFLCTHGEGLHHVAFKTSDSFDEVIEEARKNGEELELFGSMDNRMHRYAYLNRQADMKVLAEVYCMKEGCRLPKPIMIYPPKKKSVETNL